MLTFIQTEDLPTSCKTCEDMKDRAHYFVSVQYMGKTYYIPITPRVAKFFEWPIRHGPHTGDKKISFENELAIESFFIDIIASVYLQIRDTVGAEIKNDLLDQVSKGFENIFADKISKSVDDKLDGRLLEDKNQ